MQYDLEGRTPFGRSRAEDRVAFVRNVYLWLMGGFGVAAVGALSAPYVLKALAPALGCGVRLGAVRRPVRAPCIWASAVSRRKPLNRYAYALFTYICGIFAGIVMAVVASTSGPGIVLAAFGMTAADFLLLTAVAVFSKADFSFLRSFVIVGIGVMFFGSLVAAIFHLETFGLVISAVAVIACSAKILWDTSAMLGPRTTAIPRASPCRCSSASTTSSFPSSASSGGRRN